MVKKLLSLIIMVCMVTGIAACSAATPSGGEGQDGSVASYDGMKIGVSVYNTQDAEVQAIRSYLVDYIAPAFDVKFLYSDSLLETEDEIAFIESLHESGAKGLISFLSTDLDQVLSKCDELGMVYMRGSGTISDEAYETACKHESFLGIIGPEWELERRAGYEMVSYFTSTWRGDAPSILILCGGGSVGNVMHEERTLGMLNALKVKYGLKYTAEPSDLAKTGVFVENAVERGSVELTLLPGYLSREETLDVLADALSEKDYDIVLGAMALNNGLPMIETKEKTSGMNIRIGMVDCFTEQNYDWFEKKDPYGDSTINYVTGKYGATVGPAFAAMYNALTGNEDFLKPEGKGFRFKQSFWTARSLEEYEDLYQKSVNVYDNIYGASELRSVIRLYNAEATYEQFKTLTERDNQ